MNITGYRIQEVNIINEVPPNETVSISSSSRCEYTVLDTRNYCTLNLKVSSKDELLVCELVVIYSFDLDEELDDIIKTKIHAKVYSLSKMIFSTLLGCVGIPFALLPDIDPQDIEQQE